MWVANAWGFIHPKVNPFGVCITSNDKLLAVGRNCPAVGAEKHMDNQRRNIFFCVEKNFAHAKGAARKRRYANSFEKS